MSGKLVRVRLFDLLIAVIVYCCELAFLVYLAHSPNRTDDSEPMLLILRWPIQIQGMLLIPFAVFGSILVTRGVSIQADDNWKRGGLQLLTILVGVAILAAPFLVRLPWLENIYSSADPVVCPVHKVTMKLMLVRLPGEGLFVDPTEEYASASSREFPYALEDYSSFGTRATILWRVRVCQKCNEARAKWMMHTVGNHE